MTQLFSGRLLLVWVGLGIWALPAAVPPNPQGVTASGLSTQEAWSPIFNGRDLEGWTAKIRGYDCGDNFADTFRVRDGSLVVNYDGYGDQFHNRFGHLFWHEQLSHYRLRVEYRFTGNQMADGPGWACATAA